VQRRRNVHCRGAGTHDDHILTLEAGEIVMSRGVATQGFGETGKLFGYPGIWQDSRCDDDTASAYRATILPRDLKQATRLDQRCNGPVFNFGHIAPLEFLAVLYKSADFYRQSNVSVRNALLCALSGKRKRL